MTARDASRLLRRVRTGFAADAVGIAAAAVLVDMATAALPVLGAESRTVHLITSLLAVAVLAGVAVVAVAGPRALRQGPRAWTGAACGLFAVLCLPLGALGPRTLQESPAVLTVLVTANMAVAALLLFGWSVPTAPDRVVPWLAAGGGFAAAVAAGGLLRRAPAEWLDGTAPVVVATVGWLAAAALALLSAWRTRDLTTWRVGLGLAVMGLGQGQRLVAGGGFAEPDLIATGLQLVGAVGILGAALRRLRGQVSGLMNERDQQRREVQEAVAHVERAAALARERDHELANGLAGLAGIAYLLDQADDTPSADGAALRSAVLTELARLHALLADPGAAPGPQPSTAVFDLGAVLGDLAVLHRAGGTQIDLDVDGPLPAAGDRDAVVQVVTNLLANCERHAPGSRVLLRARRDGGRLVTEVHDDGPGAPVESRSQLIERGVTGAATGGSGLGLYLSRQLLVERGGDLRVLNTEGRGFRVLFELPAARPHRGTGDDRIAS